MIWPDVSFVTVSPLYSENRSSSNLNSSAPKTSNAVDRASASVGDGPVTAVRSAPSAGAPVRGSIM